MMILSSALSVSGRSTCSLVVAMAERKHCTASVEVLGGLDSREKFREVASRALGYQQPRLD